MTKPLRTEDFVLLYDDQLAVASELKDKAWKATHYSVLAQAAIVVISQASVCLSCVQQILLTGLSVIVLSWVSFLVNHLQWHLLGRREALVYLRELRGCEEFNESFQDVWDRIQELKKPDTPPWNVDKVWWEDNCEIFLVYVTAIVVPFVVVLVSIWWW